MSAIEFRVLPGPPPTERWCECCGDAVVGNAEVTHDFCSTDDCEMCQDSDCPCCGVLSQVGEGSLPDDWEPRP
jgi:hypothetical protein